MLGTLFRHSSPFRTIVLSRKEYCRWNASVNDALGVSYSISVHHSPLIMVLTRLCGEQQSALECSHAR